MTRKLSDDTIEVWHFELNEEIFSIFIGNYYILSDEEKQKVNEYKIELHKKKYILSCIILRLLLSLYSGIKPELIEIYRNKYNKPFVSYEGFHFNLSHSRNILVIALAMSEIGIDIEYCDSNLDVSEVIGEVLSNSEKKVIEKLSPNMKKKQFFHYWTQKEALLKAMGIGLNLDPKKLDTSAFKRTNNNNYKFNDWIIEPFNTLDKNYVGHFAYKNGNKKNIKHYNADDFISIDS